MPRTMRFRATAFEAPGERISTRVNRGGRSKIYIPCRPPAKFVHARGCPVAQQMSVIEQFLAASPKREAARRLIESAPIGLDIGITPLRVSPLRKRSPGRNETEYDRSGRRLPARVGSAVPLRTHCGCSTFGGCTSACLDPD